MAGLRHSLAIGLAAVLAVLRTGGLAAALGLALATVLGPVTATAQDADAGAGDSDSELTLPPVIVSAPGEARLEPPAADREDALEAVVTEGDNPWRLPDLGTSLREEEPELAPDQRIKVEFVPLYDPESEEPELDLTPNPDVMRGVGFLEFIRVGFGRRSPD